MMTALKNPEVKVRLILLAALCSLLLACTPSPYVFSIFSQETNAHQTEILSYQEKEAQYLQEKQAKIMEIYNEITDLSETSSQAYLRTMGELIPASLELAQDANTIYADIKDTDLRSIHINYINYCGQLCTAFSYLSGYYANLDQIHLAATERCLERSEYYLQEYLAELDQLPL